LPSRSWVSAVAATLLASFAVAGCGDDGGDLSDEATLRIYVSLPMRGPSGADGRDAADGARMALADAGGEAGGVAVEAVYLDATEGSGDAARWTPAQAAANARAATQDSTAVAYLGDFESGATRASLPVTNEALMLQVSPASGAVDLVAPEVGADEVPDVQPSGERSFGRVIPADDAQAGAAAQWALDLQVSRAAIRSDHTRFGRTLADGFELAASHAGLAVSGQDAPVVYLAGRPTPSGAREIGSDAYLLPPGQDAPPLVTSAALDPSQLPSEGQDFVDRFAQEYGRQPGRYAAYGYEAMAVILDSIERASHPGDRTAVIDAFFDTADRDSLLGAYSIDGLGNTTLDRMTGYGENGPVALAVP
jgi:branched-chain amino acid transport system substrate-binding protein